MVLYGIVLDSIRTRENSFYPTKTASHVYVLFSFVLSRALVLLSFNAGLGQRQEQTVGCSDGYLVLE